MTLRLKTLILIGLTLIILIGALYIALRSILLNGFAALEEREISTEVHGVTTFLNAEVEEMYMHLLDWASWDATYEFATSYDEAYVNDNIFPETFESLSLNIMLYLNDQDSLILAAGIEPDGEIMANARLAVFYDAIARHLENSQTTSFSGFMVLDDEVIMVARRPILQNGSVGRSQGTLVWARILDETRVNQYITSLTHRFSLSTVDNPVLDDEYRAAIDDLVAGGESYVSNTTHERVAFGYSLINDVTGQADIVLRVVVGREVYREGLESTLYFLVTLMIIGVILILSVLYIIENFVLIPILRLGLDVRTIGSTRDFSTRLPVHGKDELAELAGGINTLLEAVETSSEALQQLNAGLESRVEERTREIEEKNHELARLQAQKDVFFARASHELRTPLTNIITRVYLLEKQPQQLETHLRVLKLVSTYMRDLINEILEISRIQRGSITLNRTRLDLQSVVRDVIDMQMPEADKQSLTLRAEMSESLICISADQKRITQIMTNLVTNAIHYTPAGGEIVVKVNCTDDQRAVISVCDNGMGIAPEHLSHLFEPFFRAREDVSFGTGLGLMIVRELVKLHDGEVSVESELGKGSTFTVTLPQIKAKVAQPALASLSAQHIGAD